MEDYHQLEFSLTLTQLILMVAHLLNQIQTLITLTQLFTYIINRINQLEQLQIKVNKRASLGINSENTKRKRRTKPQNSSYKNHTDGEEDYRLLEFSLTLQPLFLMAAHLLNQIQTPITLTQLPS